MFPTRLPRAVVLALLVIAPALAAQESQKYLLPPQNIIDVFDAEPPAQISVSPNKQQIALVKARAYPTIAELSQPMYRLAGARINPKTNGPHRASGLPGTGINSIVLKKIDGGAETTVTMPPQARISHVKFSPDGAHLAFLQTKDIGIELWIANTATGAAKAVVTGSDRINATGGDPCDWLHDNVTMVCELVPANRGAAPVEPTVPPGPTVHENYGKAAPAPTYEDPVRRCAVRVLLHEPARGHQHRDRHEDTDRQDRDLQQRHAVSERPVRARVEDQEAVLAHRAGQRLQPGHRGLVA
jgi:dipeptidyl aminopeptidase/acylaminoacyl peptidase